MDGRTRRKLATRDRILQAARRLFAERGFTGVGLGEIADAAGVSRQTVYAHHFATKRELLFALLDHVEQIEGFADLIPPAFAAPNGVEALRLAVLGNTQFESRVADVARVLEGARRSDPLADEGWHDRVGAKRRGIGDLMDRVEREGALRSGWSSEPAADLVYALCSGQFVDILITERGWSVDACSQATWQLIGGTLLASSAGSR